jgi:hypothetical protein
MYVCIIQNDELKTHYRGQHRNRTFAVFVDMSGIIHSKQAQANLMLVTVCGPHRIGPGRVAQREAASMDVYAGLCNARPGCRGVIFQVSWFEAGQKFNR